MHSKIPLLALFLLLVSVSSLNAYVVSIHVPAVLENENMGTLTSITLNVTSGSGSVVINGPASVDQTTLLSAETAASYAAWYLNLKVTNYNFNFTINNSTLSVSGPSGGLAFTLLAVAGLEHKQMLSNFTATGTISANGVVGAIGGVYDKSGGAKAGGMSFILVPATSNDSAESLLYYIAQQTYNIPEVPVANISQALPYAFGTATPKPYFLNLTQGFNIASMPNSSVTCSNCNTAAFGMLVNDTFNFTGTAISGIPGNFNVVRQQLISNLNQYETVANKGYLYSGADFAFIDFAQSYVLSHAGEFIVYNASSTLSNVSTYCSSLLPPQMTTNNYEFVLAGKLRLLWANITITDAKTLLSAEITTDDVIDSLRTAATALAWCKAADSSFTIAASLGGNNIEISSNIKPKVLASINHAKTFGTNLYLQAAYHAYNSGDYGTAYYASIYANIYGPLSITGNLTQSQLKSATLSNIGNATSGTWPAQFAKQAEFFLNQATLTKNKTVAKGLVMQAYTVSVLAESLAVTNLNLSKSFIVSSTASLGQQQINTAISNINQSLSQLYFMLFVLAALFLIVLVVLVVHMLETHGTKPQKGRRRKRR